MVMSDKAMLLAVIEALETDNTDKIRIIPEDEEDVENAKLLEYFLNLPNRYKKQLLKDGCGQPPKK